MTWLLWKDKLYCCFVAKSWQTLGDPMDSMDPMEPARLLCPWDTPGKNTGAHCHSLLQEIFQPKDRTPVSCTVGRSFTTEPAGKP